MKVIVLKPSIDTKGNDCLVSRIGARRKVDFLVAPTANVENLLENYLDSTDCILVDEAQFLTESQADELYNISKEYNIPVICYGLRTDFMTEGFPGSTRLLLIADELEEMPTICACGTKVRFNGRKVNGEFVSEGSQVAIDETGDVTYESLCGRCYQKKVRPIRTGKKY